MIIRLTADLLLEMILSTATSARTTTPRTFNAWFIHCLLNPESESVQGYRQAVKDQ